MNSQKINFSKPREVAEILKLNTITIYQYIKQGQLPAVKFGRNYRISEKDLEDFIKRNIVKRK